MPSKKNSQNKKKIDLNKHEVFLPILFLTFFLWLLYRRIFHFSVLFDESIGKLVFFALPVLIYVSISGSKEILATFSLKKIKSGLLLGLAFGGIFGFIGALIGTLGRGGQVSLVPYYFTDWFWQEMFLALLTGFWETLFFYSFVMVVIDEKFQHFSLLKKINLVAIIYLLFHLPNIFNRFTSTEVFLQILLIFAFACGQALLFYKRRNAYVLVLVQAIWGMVLLLHF
ncbi:MAG TPA: hypothetical protein PLQ50_00270 [Candidatus Woesebacteria bacterium]|nr:hypothetical protein [Candidatus Woesebacteria bacterium]